MVIMLENSINAKLTSESKMHNILHPATIQEYLELCKMFNETPHRASAPGGRLIPDINSHHALELQKRALKQVQAIVQTSAAPPKKQAIVFKPVDSYVNAINQVIFPGDPVISITQGYNHQVKAREGIFDGVTPGGYPRVITHVKVTSRWDEKGNDIGFLKRRFDPAIVHETRLVARKSWIPSGRVYKLDMSSTRKGD